MVEDGLVNRLGEIWQGIFVRNIDFGAQVGIPCMCPAPTRAQGQGPALHFPLNTALLQSVLHSFGQHP